MTKNLFTPLQLGELVLPNRILMAPLTRSRATPGSDAPHAGNALYYAQRASAGLIISEATQVCAEGKGYINTPGIYSDAQLAGWQQVTHAVHAAGGRIIAQLWHVGRVSHSSFQPGGVLPAAASAICPPGKIATADGTLVPFEVPRSLELHEVQAMPALFAHAASIAQQAGFDGVEVHSAHGYLLESFIRDISNSREDAYGGTLERRLRLPLEVIDAVVGVWGKGRVGVRLSPVSLANSPQDSAPQATYGALLAELIKRRLAFVHFVEGNTGRSRELAGFDFAAAKAALSAAGMAYIANNQYTAEMAHTAVASGAADAVAIGVPFISNPDLVERIAHNQPWAAANKARFYGGGADGYTDYPRFEGGV
jgi:N-ethylmaleimide reductase